MGKLYNDLQKQLELEDYKSDAEKCIKVYNDLKRCNDGHVWSSDWGKLTNCNFIRNENGYPKKIYSLSNFGEIYLKHIENNKKLKVMKKLFFIIQLFMIIGAILAGIILLIGEPVEGGAFDSFFGVMTMKLIGALCIFFSIIWIKLLPSDYVEKIKDWIESHFNK